MRCTPAERKLVTVLFVDLVNSSALIADQDPEQADQILFSVVNDLAEVVRQWGGTVSQLLGDGLMAVFGAPVAQEDHALRACLAAQDMGSRADLRIGISSGEVVAQVITSDVWSDYRLVGQTVHLAAKLQQRAAPGEVLIAEPTRQLVMTGLTSRPAGMLALSPDSTPVAVHRMLQMRRTRRSACQISREQTGPLIGRATEIARLERHLSDLDNGIGSALMLVGDAGSGKSRLLAEILGRNRDGRFVSLQWQFSPLRRLSAAEELKFFTSLLRDALGPDGDSLLGEDPEPGSGLSQGGLSQGELAQIAMRTLFGLPAEDPDWSGLMAAQKVSIAIEALVGRMAKRARIKPVLLLAEDTHWASETAGRLLDALKAAADNEPILVLATSRPPTGSDDRYAVTGWQPASPVTIMKAGPLSPADSETYLNIALGPHPSLTPLKRQIASQSLGSPLYLEQSVRSLVAQNAVTGAPGTYRLANNRPDLRLPLEIHGLMAARIDALAPDVRAILLLAAVIGTTVDPDLLALIAPSGPVPIADQLKRLVAEGLLQPLENGHDLRFVSSLLHDVALGTVPVRERRPLHRAILQGLSRLSVTEKTLHLAMLAHHALAAESWGEACLHGLRAGRRAEIGCEPGEAARFYQGALTALGHLPRTARNARRLIDLWMGLARVSLSTEKEGCGDMLDQAVALATSLGDDNRRSRAEALRVAYLVWRGELAGALASGYSTLSRVGDRCAADVLVPLLLQLGIAQFHRGAYRLALSHLAETRQLAMAVITARSTPPAPSDALAVAATEAGGIEAICLAQLGRDVDAMLAARQANDLAARIGNGSARVCASLKMGLVHLLAGRFEDARMMIGQSLALAEATSNASYQPLTLAAFGYLLAAWEKRPDHGQRFIDAALQLATQREQMVVIPLMLMWESCVLREAGDAAAAVAKAREAIGAASAGGLCGTEAWALLALSRAEYALAQSTDNRQLRLNAELTLLKAEVAARTLSMQALSTRCSEIRTAQPRDGQVPAAADH